MGLRYNPFTGSFDLTRSPGSYLDGEVATYGDLPLDTAAAPLNSAWLVRGASGLWLLSRKPAGIYIRTATTGDRDADYTYAGTFPDVFSDANFVVYNDADSTKNVKLDASGITTGTTRTLTVPDKSGTIATTSDLPDDYTVVSTAGNLANGDRVAANTTSAAFTLTLPASPANGDTIYVLDYAGTFASNNLTIARNGNNIESLAEDLVCNVEKAAFSLVYAGSTVGWKVVPQTAQMPSTSLANTWQVNQTFNGTNNTAPNQTAASGSSILTRDLGDARYGEIRNLNLVVLSNWSAGSTSVSGGSTTALLTNAQVRANAGAGNRARQGWFLYIGTSRGIDWSKKVRGTLVFVLNGDSRGTVRAVIGERSGSYNSGNPTLPCAGFKVTGSTLTAFVHDGTTYTEHGTGIVSLSGNNWAFAIHKFEFESDGAGNISYTLNGSPITGGTGARTTQAADSEAVVQIAESDAACTAITDLNLLRVVVEQL